MRKKIRVNIPKLVYDVIVNDTEYFGLKKESLYNTILQELGFEKINEIGKELLDLDDKRLIVFNLNELNTSLINDMQNIHMVKNDRELVIKVFSTYANLHPAIREKVTRKDFFFRLEQAIREKREVTILYKSSIRVIFPLSFERDNDTGFNYLKVRLNGEEFLYEVKDITFVS